MMYIIHACAKASTSAAKKRVSATLFATHAQRIMPDVKQMGCVMLFH